MPTEVSGGLANALNREQTLAAIYVQGVSDHRRGVLRADDPYRGNDEGSKAWLAGWNSRDAFERQKAAL